MSDTIRMAGLADVPALVDLAAETFPLACPPESSESELRAHIATHLNAAVFQAWIQDDRDFVYVASSPAGLQGYCAVAFGSEEEDRTVRQALTLRPSCELSKCYVRPQSHRKGIAGGLIGAARVQARGQARGMWLGVNAKNTAAIAAYEALGFSRIGVRHYDVGGRIHTDHLLELPL